MFLKPSLVGQSFLRLSEIDPLKKVGMERTSTLFRFLAFDALSKIRGKAVLLFDPDSAFGHQNRQDLHARYSEIARVKQLEDGKEWLIDNLGSVNTDGHRTCYNKVSNDLGVALLKH